MERIFSRISFRSKLARSGGYRPDVDGLRAIAVLPVLFFHAAIPGFSGGFVGVDIFYVISGYLITSIVAKDVAREKFSLVSFYERRIRRIFPALFGVLFFSLLAAAVLLDPKEFAAFGKSLVAVTFFVGNIFFKRHGAAGGYFAADASHQALLHTWSLSVEEQFYLFFPTAFTVLLRWTKGRTARYLALGAVVSFVVNIWATYNRPLSAFYIFVPRAWELLLGSLLAIKALPSLRRRLTRELASVTGLGLIAWAVSAFTKVTPFPGFAALYPCLGSWLIIYAGENGPSVVKTILSFDPLVFIGVISYSLYLWHWPILVFSKYFFAGNLTARETAIALAFSLLMAFISYEFVESPFRGADSRIARNQVFSFALATSIISAALGFAIYLSRGVPTRFNEATRQLISQNMERKSDYEEACSNWKRDFHRISDINFCNMGTPTSKKIMFWGDSHVQQLYPLIRNIYDSGGLQKYGVVFAVDQGCTPSEHLNRPEPGFHCDSFTHFALMRAEEADIDTVYIGFSAPEWNLCPSVDGRCVGKISDEGAIRRVLQELSKHIRKLRMLGKRVIVSLPFPLFDRSIPDLQIRNEIVRRLGIAPIPVTEISSPILRNQIAFLAESMGAEVFDPRKSLCPDGHCIAEAHGVSIYKDASHLAASQIGILEGNMKRALQPTLSVE